MSNDNLPPNQTPAEQPPQEPQGKQIKCGPSPDGQFFLIVTEDGSDGLKLDRATALALVQHILKAFPPKVRPGRLAPGEKLTDGGLIVS